MNDYYLEEGSPFSPRKLKKLRLFLKEAGLDYDEEITYSVTVCSSKGSILACGSRHKNILKCLAVAEEYQGMGYLNIIMTRLTANAHTEGFSHLFLFTKPEYTAVFEDLGFYSILNTGQIQFMENNSYGIRKYLKEEARGFERLPDNMTAGAIVMNANPFTLGHQYLVEEARKHCDILHVFVLSEETPPFPAADRLALVQEGCRHLPGVYVHGGSEYLISHATFPDYFMKDKKDAVSANGRLDLLVFCRYFKEAFHISRRFAGEEPFCPVTRAYNAQMQEILPDNGIEVFILPRHEVEGIPVSATRVRKYLEEGNLEAIRPLVPDSTWLYLSGYAANTNGDSTSG